MRSELLFDFERYLNGLGFAPDSVRAYLSDLEHFSGWFERTRAEALRMDLLRSLDVENYRSSMLTRCSARTINRRLDSLSALTFWAWQSGLVRVDPCAELERVNEFDSRPKWLEKWEQEALERAIQNDLLAGQDLPRRRVTRRRDAALVVFLLQSGLRLGEALRIGRQDVYLTEQKGSLRVWNKRGDRLRTVPLNSRARAALLDWESVHPGSDFLWIAVEGDSSGPLSARTVQRVLRRYARLSGIEELTPEVCRHTFARNLALQGAGIVKVAALLGSADLNTARVYFSEHEGRALEIDGS
jgi:site-specific recombinase XerD